MALVLATLACLTIAGPLQPASTAPARSSAEAAGGGDPWQDPGYAPTKGDWRPYLLAPASRDVPAAAVVGAVANDGSVTDGPAVISGAGTGATLTYAGTDAAKSPRITLDFGKEVTGRLALTVTGTSANPPKLRAAFSESLLFMSTDGKTGTYGDQANSTSSPLGILGGADPYKLPNDYESHPITLTPHPAGTPPTTVQDTAIRGGFRYVALFLESAGSVSINSVHAQFSSAPKQADLRDYKGWFLSSDNLMNKLWYSGAYTMQTDTIDPKQGGCVPPPPLTTDNPSCVVAEGDSVLVDGAKRDRLPWGFVNFEESVAYTSTQDYASAMNNIKTRLDLQRENGYVPGTSPATVNTSSVLLGPFLEIHAATTRSAYDYILYSGDMSFATQYFPKIQKAEQYTLSFLDSTGLVNDNSFGCLHDIGYAECAHTTTINALTYQSLTAGADYADLVGQPAQAGAWRQQASALAKVMNAKLYDPVRGAFVQSLESSGVISQEGSALSAYWGAATTGNAQHALAYLKATGWNQYGSAIWDRPGGNMKSGADATLPWARYDDPYPSYYEMVARIEQHDDQDAADLMRRYWGHMLESDPRYPGAPPQTMWERESLDGLPTLVTNFPAPLVSQSHDWGAGPTAALTGKVLGVTPTQPGFTRFAVRPHPLDLTWAQGAVPTPAGPVLASYDVGDRRPGVFSMDVTVPPATKADVSVPLLGARRTITVDGAQPAPTSQDDYYATFTGLAPGTHHFEYAGLDGTKRDCPAAFGPTWPAGTTATATETAEPRTLQPADVSVFDASNSVDGNPASSWEAAGKGAASLTVRPPSPQSLDGLRVWLGIEGPPGRVRVSVQTNGQWDQVAQHDANSNALVDVPLGDGRQVQAVRLDLDGAQKDALGAQRVRVFEVQPLIDARAPLALAAVVPFSCTAAGLPPVQAPDLVPVQAPDLVGPSGDVPIHFHYSKSDVGSSGGSTVRVMDLTAPATSSPPFGEHYDSTGNPGPGDSTHFQWASPPMSQIGLRDGVDFDSYQFHVWVFASYPGYQPANLATLHVDLYRVQADGSRVRIAPASAGIPAATLNQEILVAGTVPLAAHLAPGERLFADAYITGTRASILYFSYDDRSFDSGISLHRVATDAPPADVPEAPWTPALPLVGLAAALVLLMRRRGRRATEKEMTC